MFTEKQINQVIEFENNFRNLINAEIDYEKNEKTTELITRITNKKTDEKETIRNLTLGFEYYNENSKQFKFKSSNILDTEINERDRILITDENFPFMPLEGIVVRKKQKEIKLEYIDDKILDVGPPERCRIDLYVKESTYRRQLDNLKNLSPEGKYALHFALKHKEPKNNAKIENIHFYDPELNNSQKEAIKRSLNSQHFFLIHGPFGTGKTKTLVEIIRQEAELKKKILVSADSNAAVDNIVERLTDTDLKIIRIGNDDKINDEIKKYSLTLKTKKHPDYQKIIENNNKLSELHEKLDTTKNMEINEVNHLKFKIKQKYQENQDIQNNIHKEILEKSQIILTTNTSAALEVLSDCHFDVAIIDEASQTTIPSVLIPISKADKFILAGDPKQLPPTVTSNNDELKETLFELLQNNFPQQQKMLNEQNRMNEKLMEFPNNEFYEGKLKCGEKSKNYFLKKHQDHYHHKSPILFIDTSLYRNNEEKQYESSTSFYNTLESKIASKITTEYIQSKVSKSEIGIITPYADQVNLIKRYAPVLVDTVDGFQGNEKDVIIISMVRSNKSRCIKFVADPKRLNVTLTRAKKKLIIIGNSTTLKREPIYRKLIEFCEKKRCIYDKTF